MGLLLLSLGSLGPVCFFFLVTFYTTFYACEPLFLPFGFIGFPCFASSSSFTIFILLDFFLLLGLSVKVDINKPQWSLIYYQKLNNFCFFFSHLLGLRSSIISQYLGMIVHIIKKEVFFLVETGGLIN